jgi:hypothetical protein
MGASDAWAYSTLGAIQKCECADTVARGERMSFSLRGGAKKVLAIYEPRFIFTPLSLRVDGLPTQVTTELPGNESTMGSEALDHR